MRKRKKKKKRKKTKKRNKNSNGMLFWWTSFLFAQFLFRLPNLNHRWKLMKHFEWWNEDELIIFNDELNQLNDNQIKYL